MKLKILLFVSLILFESCKSQENSCLKEATFPIDKTTTYQIDFKDFALTFLDVNTINNTPNEDFELKENKDGYTMSRLFLESDNLFEKKFIIKSNKISILNIEVITLNDYVFSGEEKIKKQINLSKIDNIKLSCNDDKTFKIPFIKSSFNKNDVYKESLKYFTAFQSKILNSKENSKQEKEVAKKALKKISLSKKNDLNDLFVSYENLNFNLIITYIKDGIKKSKKLKFINSNNKEVLNTNKENSNVYIENDKLIIVKNQKKIELKNLIVNQMSLTTSLKIEDENIFYLIYEYTASSVKRQIAYKFYHNNEIFLIYKESISYGREGIKSNRIYFQDFKIQNNVTIENIESFNFDKKFSFYNPNLKAETKITDYKGDLIGNIKYAITNKDLLNDFPLNNKKNIVENFEILNVEKFNNLAYNFEQFGNDNEAIFLLEKILNQYPDRTVAWLNIGDAQWDAMRKENTKKSYQKYISLMKSQKKDLKKIPQRVYDRIK